MSSDKKKGGGGGVSSEKDCANCGAPDGTVPGQYTHKSCSRCKVTFYCNRACQSAHWKTGGHKQHCLTPEQRSLAAQERAAASIAEEENKRRDLNAAQEEKGCSICLDSLSSGTKQTLPCSHIFHVACVERLRSFGIQQACPLCRSELPPGLKQVFHTVVCRWIVLGRRLCDVQDIVCPFIPLTSNDITEMDEVLRMAQEAADKGYLSAQIFLGQVFDIGQGVPQDHAKAVEFYQMCADQGLAEAQCSLGLAYSKGRGIEEDHAKAVDYFRRAANQGLAEAQYSLGVAYSNGQGVEKNFDKAVELWGESADQRYAQAQYNLGIAYSKGICVTLNPDTAAELWQKAADQGHVEAQNNLGIAYAKGIGVPQCYSTALL